MFFVYNIYNSYSYLFTNNIMYISHLYLLNLFFYIELMNKYINRKKSIK